MAEAIDAIVRTRNDTMPSGSNWARAWHRALESVGQKPIRVYDCRHAAATTLLRVGMPRRGRSTTRALRRNTRVHDDERIANQRIDSILG